MNRPRLTTALRIAFSATCLIVCVLLIALWVRSYWCSDTVWGHLPPRISLSVNEICGDVIIKAGPTARDEEGGWAAESSELNDYLRIALQSHIRANTSAGFGILDERPISWIVFLPIWSLMVLAASIGLAPWIRWSKRFSLRTLLIATTLVAVVLGLIVWAAR